MSAVELSLTDIMDKIVVDDWGQCKSGKFGALRAHVETGRLSEATLHAELGQIVAGRAAGRESDDETILFWHRGLSLSDIALGKAMLDKAQASRHRPAAALRVSAIILTGAGIGVEDVAAVARAAAPGRDRADRRWSALRKARARARPVAASGQQIYGLNTGLGANLRHAGDRRCGAFQRQLLEGRSGAVGDPLPTDIVRATMFARAAMLSVGGSGISPDVLVGAGRGAECRRPSRHAVARLDRRRRPRADDGARPAC